MSIPYQLALVWHFLLSEVLLREQGNQDMAAASLFAHLEHDSTAVLDIDGNHFQLQQMDLLQKLQLLIATAALNRVEIGLFTLILEDCRMNWTQLYRQYVGKNVLNFFRQDHGYKEGTYQKIWHGREDNEHLVELINSLPEQADDFPERLYQALKKHYPA